METYASQPMARLTLLSACLLLEVVWFQPVDAQMSAPPIRSVLPSLSSMSLNNAAGVLNTASATGSSALPVLIRFWRALQPSQMRCRRTMSPGKADRSSGITARPCRCRRRPDICNRRHVTRSCGVQSSSGYGGEPVDDRSFAAKGQLALSPSRPPAGPRQRPFMVDLTGWTNG